MAKKSTPSPTPSESELVEAVNRLTDCVSVLANIADLVRSDIDWIINNRAEFPLLQPVPTTAAELQTPEKHSTIKFTL